jgi:hypothetical protein
MPTVSTPSDDEEAWEIYMTPKNEFNRANRTVSYSDGTPTSSESLLSSRVIVTPGPLIQGNFKAPNSWSYFTEEESFISGKVDYVENGTGYASHQLGPMVNSSLDDARVLFDDSYMSNTYNKALERLNEKVRGSLDLGVAAAELSSTRRMLNITDGLTRTIDGLGQRKLALAKRVVREVSGRYLEWRYGWQPLLTDLYGAANESIRYVLNRTETVTANAVMKYPERVDRTLRVEGRDLPFKLVQAGKAVTRITVTFDTSNVLDRWTSLNPASIAWELTPYSFVADWFYDVGGFLREMETGFLYRNRFLNGYVSSLNAQEISGSMKSSVNTGYGIRTYEGKYSHKRRKFERTVLSSYPLPRLPSWKAKLGSERLLSAAALLSQFLNNSPQKDPLKYPRQSSRGGFGKSYWEKRASDLLLKHGLIR